MRIIVKDTEQELDMAAALEVTKQVIVKPDSVITFAGGQTTIGLHHEIVHLYQQWGVDYSKMKAFTLDEYVGLSPEDHKSVSFRIRNQVLDHLNIKSEHIHMPDGMAEDLDTACHEYSRLLDKHPVDLEVLGIGTNGHIGFNEPGTAFHLDTHVKDLESRTAEMKAGFFGSAAMVPKQGLTVGIKRIMMSKQILLLAKGESKAEIIKKALYGEITPEIPASVLQLHPFLTVILDKEAAKIL
ncbi:glucosamine-6-phosphate deaminase [Paenibacillus segetis]|uniref:Glucosamine-6-phosphate deaminase n=1 Tax=Paenibacillus segetis TaxID=1325360 RepID=A0ABQ1Y5J0_9BACL|nr:glucosamine-6-phosphate deaminase [Paenibacillus segetis]GGH12065.1 glucosamine-6-phosphate deaminase [Paenibacillus segetis]